MHAREQPREGNRAAVESLLALLVADPRDAARAVTRATSGAQKKAVLDALGTDARFGPPLRAAIREATVLKEAPWLVRFLGLLRFTPAVPELLAVWRMRDERVSYQAGQALLRIGDAKALETMAADVPSTRGTQASVALDAAFLRGGTYDRLAPLVATAHANAASVLYRVAQERRPFAAEPRWKDLALDVVRRGPDDVVDAARELLTRGLSKKELRDALADESPEREAPSAEGRRAHEESLRKARASVAKLLAALPKAAWTKAKKKDAALLDELEALVGRLPAFVRAFYEQASAITVAAKAPGRRFVLTSLTQVAVEARSWAKKGRVPAKLRAPFFFPVAPDAYALAGYSGGPPIGFEMPTASEDPPLLHTRGNPRFWAFLRRARRAG